MHLTHYLRKAALRLDDRRVRRALHERLYGAPSADGRPDLERAMRRAAEDVPYYRSRLSLDADLLDQFSRLPPLSKEEIRAHFDALQSRHRVDGAWYQNSSGGSTGQPVTLIQDREYALWSDATTEYYFRAFLGAEPRRDRKIILWGSERDLFERRRSARARWIDWREQTTFLNSFQMSSDAMRQYVATINSVRPVYIKGYAGSLYQLARFIDRTGFDIHSPRFIYSAAETLRPFMRETIEQTFGCTVYDYYGSREVGAIAGECSLGMMHTFSFNTWVEVVDRQNQPVAVGEEGRVLVTTLHNHTMPLLRYEIGDTAVRGAPCGCGSPLPTLERITGRVTDHFTTRSGDLIHGEYFTHLFYFREWVGEFQVLQEELDRVQIYYVPRCTPPADDLAEIDAKIRLVMGDDCHVAWTRVDEVPRTPQGKLLFTRSLVDV